MWRHDGARSDGYLAHIFRHAAKELFHEDVGEVTYRTLRSVGAGRAAGQGPGWEPLEGDKFIGGASQEQRPAGGHPGERRPRPPALRGCLWLPEHPERGLEAEAGQSPLPPGGGLGLSWG